MTWRTQVTLTAVAMLCTGLLLGRETTGPRHEPYVLSERDFPVQHLRCEAVDGGDGTIVCEPYLEHGP